MRNSAYWGVGDLVLPDPVDVRHRAEAGGPGVGHTLGIRRVPRITHSDPVDGDRCSLSASK